VFSIIGLAANSQNIIGEIVFEGNFIENATVFLHELSKFTTSNNQGNFQFHQIPNGTYHIHVNSLGFEPEIVLVQVPQKQPLSINLHQTAIEIKEIEIEESVLSSINENRARDIEVISQTEISNSSANGLAEIMAKLPGVQMINIGNNSAKPIIRGLGFNRTITNYNGIKQEGQQWGADHGLTIDEGNIDRIEIVKGANSLIYGSDALGGVINFHQNSTLPNKGISGRLGLKLNSVNMRYAPNFSLAFRKKDFFIKTSGSISNSGDLQVPATTFNYNSFVFPIYNNRLKNTASKTFAYGISSGWIKKWGQVRLNHSLFKQRIGFFPGAHGRPNFNLLFEDSNRFNIDMPHQNILNHNTSLQTDFYLPYGWLEVDAGFQQNIREEFEIPHIHKLGPTPANNLALSLGLNTFSVNARYHLVPENGKSIVGISAQSQSNSEKGYEYFLPSYKSQQIGAFWYREKPLKETVIINYGFRGDLLSQEIDSKTIPIYNINDENIGDTTLTNESNNSFQNLTSALGLVFKPNHNKTIKVNLGSGFRFPTVPELSANGFHHGTFRFEVGNQNLKPERTISLDASLNYHNPNFIIQISPYFNYFFNYIFLEPTSKYATKANGGGQIHQYNQAEALHSGLEFYADWHILKQLHFELKGDAVMGYNLNTYRFLPFMPPINIATLVGYELLQNSKNYASDIYLGSNYFAAQKFVAINELQTPQSLIFNGGFSLKKLRKKSILLKFELKNIFNQSYLYHLSRFRLLNLPEPGRSFNLILNYKF